MASTYTKRALLTGAGSLYLSFMETEETPTTAPVYAEEVYETPSLETINAQLEVSENKVFLSNILHSDLSAVQSATIPVTAGLCLVYCVRTASVRRRVDGQSGCCLRRADGRRQFGEAMQSLRDGSAGARKAVRAIQQRQFGSRGFFGGPAPR